MASGADVTLDDALTGLPAEPVRDGLVPREPCDTPSRN
jgi:hypothetical protein